MRRFVAALVLVGCGKTAAPVVETAERASPSPPAPLIPTWHGVAEPEPGVCDGIRLEIRASERDGWTYFEGTLTHAGKEPVTLVAPGDGSEVGWRTPTITWEARTLSGAVAPKESGGRCGNVNPIHDDEIFVLHPGETRKLDAWMGAPEVAAGTYVVRAIYENDPKMEMRGVPLGPTPDATLAKIRASTPCRIASGSIRVHIAR